MRLTVEKEMDGFWAVADAPRTVTMGGDKARSYPIKAS